MQHLRSDLESLISPTESELQLILAEFEELHFAKGERISSFGKVARYFQFIEQGAIRVYTLDAEARDITIQIGLEKMWVNNLYSFLKQVPSTYHIEVLETTTLYQISKQKLEQLFEQVPLMERFFSLKVQGAYCRLQERTLNLINQSAEERYLQFQSRYGRIEALVPQYIIASYLSISPEHLSKVRNKLAKR